MIKIEFPADRPDIANHIGAALVALSHDRSHVLVNKRSTPHTVSSGQGTCEEQNGKNSAEAMAMLGEKDRCDSAFLEFEQSVRSSVETAFGVDLNPPKPSGADECGEDTETDGTAPHAAQTSPDLSTTSVRVDEHGVAFDEAFCANAAEPFYTTGKQRGQWKKRKGVSPEAYDAWYESQLGKSGEGSLTAAAQSADTAGPSSTVSEFATVDAASAFAAEQQLADPDAPTNGPDLMVWISEQQANGHITQQQLDEAWQVVGANRVAIFSPGGEQLVAAMYEQLTRGQ